MDMQNEESLKKLAKGWIAYNLDPKNEDTWEDWNVSSDLLYDLLEEDPQKAWQMILRSTLKISRTELMEFYRRDLSKIS